MASPEQGEKRRSKAPAAGPLIHQILERSHVRKGQRRYGARIATATGRLSPTLPVTLTRTACGTLLGDCASGRNTSPSRFVSDPKRRGSLMPTTVAHGDRKRFAAADHGLARPELTRQIRIDDHDRRRAQAILGANERPPRYESRAF
jgi:hypothetical protein